MKKFIKLSLLAILALSLNANDQADQAGLTDTQMNEVRAIMRQTQQLVAEQQQAQQTLTQGDKDALMGEDIFNDKNRNLNKSIKSNFKINPLGLNNAPTQNSRISPAEQKYIDGERQLSKEELELMKNAIRNQDLKALQYKFHAKSYSGYENTKTINYQPNKTIKIRTRHAMATTLIFDSEIDNFVLGDQTGFKIESIPNQANALAIIPQLIGIDTSLTIFTSDGKIHTFYVFSTDYKNSNNPAFIIYIKDDEAVKAKLAKQKAIDENYLVIKDGIAELKVLKTDIYKGYTQKAKKENEWLLSAEIFSDKKFTYFKYAKDEMPQIPTLYAVIDNQDNPVETRVIGDYLIAETINPKFTIKSGDSYVCVNRIETQTEKERKKIRKNLNTDKEVLKQRKKESKAVK